jgi:ubiquitin-activating enzyme E1
MLKTEEVEIDTNLYSRQIGTFGLETMGKLIKLKVLIVGMRGLGVECVKNLILAGPASVAIYDPTTVSINDLGANFYLKEAHVGNVSRATGSLEQLSELNPYVKVFVVNELLVEDHANYNVVCYTENFKSITHLMDVNRFCHANKIGFILSETLGAAGYAFLDFGD